MEKSIRKYWPIFVLPTMLAFLIGFLIPFIMGIYLSFCEFTTVADAQFVGLSNYIRIFTDPTSNFGHALWVTSLFTIVNVVLINVFGFVVALLMVRGFRGTNLFRRSTPLCLLHSFPTRASLLHCRPHPYSFR